jgi:hypothetical protein
MLDIRDIVKGYLIFVTFFGMKFSRLLGVIVFVFQSENRKNPAWNYPNLFITYIIKYYYKSLLFRFVVCTENIG